jgi:hypothetical protein
MFGWILRAVVTLGTPKEGLKHEWEVKLRKGRLEKWSE